MTLMYDGAICTSRSVSFGKERERTNEEVLEERSKHVRRLLQPSSELVSHSHREGRLTSKKMMEAMRYSPYVLNKLRTIFLNTPLHQPFSLIRMTIKTYLKMELAKTSPTLKLPPPASIAVLTFTIPLYVMRPAATSM